MIDLEPTDRTSLSRRQGRESTARGLIAIAVLSIACACGADEDAPLEVGYSALRISLPVLVAEREGFFRARGLDVTLRRYETAQPLVEEVLDGRLDAGGYAALPIVFTAASRDGSRARLATAMIEDAEHPISVLLRRTDDRSIAGPADLAGHTVGVLPTVAYQRWLDAILRHAGVDPSTVTVTPVAPPQQAAALASGSVDALLTNDPMATAIVASGAGEPAGSAPVPTALGGSLVFGSFLLHPRVVRERPDDVRRLVLALDDAIRFIEDDQRTARAHLSTYVRASERPHVQRYPDARYLTSDEADDAVFAGEAQRSRELGILEAPIDLSGWSLAP